jgi:hypothetical protein
MKIPPFIDKNFYSKCIEPFHGIYIVAHKSVSDDAIQRVNELLKLMLRSVSLTMIENLYNYHTNIFVIGKDQLLTELPEWRYMKGKLNDDGRKVDELRGYSGYGNVWVGEENLLRLESDKYPQDQNLFVREMAHIIQDYGLDDDQRSDVNDQFVKSVTRGGLWRGANAGKNEREYFAELSMWYFGYRGNIPVDDPFSDFPAKGKEALSAYDNDGYKLLDLLYSGQSISKVNYPMSRPQKEMHISKHYSELDGKKLRPDNSVITRSYLIFWNTTNTPLNVQWINYDGETVFMNEIAPKSRLIQPSFESHPFAVYYKLEDDLTDVLAGYFVVSKEPTVAAIHEMKKPSTKRVIPEIFFSFQNGAIPLSRSLRGHSII